ncbi:hypothetical protein SAMN05443244_1790 [Terriglobus roseus]|uniref:Uncharacterized protein n=1 Tax=Terriglobus roseus TaxID=392734 RepID=A0A1H4M1S2_9BACT|nr:hypothetical protein SAMN05443244_1790 [Terriglobus roseus]
MAPSDKEEKSLGIIGPASRKTGLSENDWSLQPVWGYVARNPTNTSPAVRTAMVIGTANHHLVPC